MSEKKGTKKGRRRTAPLFLFLGCIRKDFLSVDQSSDDSLEMAIVYAGSILTVYNLRPYARGDLPGSLIAAARRNFNSRPCTRGDDEHENAAVCGLIFQIHAPARGATDAYYDRLLREYISIHAPARGATRCDGAAGRGGADFNSRPCTRGDAEMYAKEAVKHKFQFTPLYEGRRRWNWWSWCCRYFNSRPCTRGDAGDDSPASVAQYFNSRPCTRGDLGLPAWLARDYQYFNSRPCTRGDRWERDTHGQPGEFQFTPLHEGRHNRNRLRHETPLFQFTPLHEGRPAA